MNLIKIIYSSINQIEMYVLEYRIYLLIDCIYFFNIDDETYIIFEWLIIIKVKSKKKIQTTENTAELVSDG